MANYKETKVNENIKFVRLGNGPKTMVMLPGLALKSTLESAPLVQEAYGEIFKDYSIFLFDDRIDLTDDYSIRKRADDVALEMEKMQLSDAYVFGASMGGMVGQYLAINHPSLVKKLCISSTTSYFDQESKKTLYKWKTLAQNKELETLIDEMTEDIYSASTLEEYGDMIKQSIGQVSDKELDDFIILTNAILDFNCYEELDRIKCPVMVIGAEGDKVIPQKYMKDIYEKLGCGFYFYGAEYGHGVYDEAPDHRKKICDFFE